MAKELERVISLLDQPGTRDAARELAVFVAGMQDRGVLPRVLPAEPVSLSGNPGEQLTLFKVERPVQVNIVDLNAKDIVRVEPLVQEFLRYRPEEHVSPSSVGPRIILTPRLAHQFRHLYGGTVSDDTLVRRVPMDELYWENVTELGWNQRDLAGLSKVRGHFDKHRSGADWAGNVWTVGDIRGESFTSLLHVKGVGSRSAVFLKFAFAKL